MTGLKLKLAGGVVSTAAVFAFAMMPAAAATAGAVVFQGTTSSLTAVQPVGGTGSYTFSTSTPALGLVPGVCADVLVNGTTVVVGAGVNSSGCSISASGSYNNIVCGTGTTGSTAQLGLAEGDSATITASTVGSGAATFNYGIVFVAGVGIIHDTNATGPAVGVVDILPTGGTCATGVTAFTATGASVLG